MRLLAAHAPMIATAIDIAIAIGIPQFLIRHTSFLIAKSQRVLPECHYESRESREWKARPSHFARKMTGPSVPILYILFILSKLIGCSFVPPCLRVRHSLLRQNDRPFSFTVLFV